MVPDQKLDVHPALLQGGPQMVTDKVALLLSGVEAILPHGLRHGLVLHCERPQRQANCLELLGEAHVVARPDVGAVLPELAAELHTADVLHPVGRAPGAGKQVHLFVLRGLGGTSHQRQHGGLVVLEVEGPQLQVLQRRAGPVALGEVARVHVNPPHAVSYALLPAEASLGDLLLAVWAHLLDQVGRALGEGAADAYEVLEMHRRVNYH
mmetsp:Transcript_10734/g.24236  ORF Transcript_10734/g.24236 Transcript_10734/m.24236 type:complete len:209 (-) Transcript_10734:61-687(-)